ncbi:MAG TPA: 2-hydroxyacid dehydrogenase [Chloroflexota bacterium]|nr:2-hydroxyacid dehydrogenase [Chloroflexota bacterium]
MVDIAYIGPHLASFARCIEATVSFPVRSRISASLHEVDIVPLVRDVPIVITSYWTASLGEAARSLRFMQVPGAGWDKIDPASIPPGVLVANCYEHEQGIAEYVVMMMLALSRKLLEADRTIRQGVWRLFPAAGHPNYPELGSRTVGIVGLGRIGREVAKLAGAFGMRRIGVDVVQIPQEIQDLAGLAWVGDLSELDRLLHESDFVVIATTLNESSRSLFDAERLGQMKSSAFLINPARAEMCVERDLYQALRGRVIAGAALDPWWHYPKADEVVAPSEHPFQELDNVIMTPHTSGSTIETMAKRQQVVASNVERFLRNEPVVNVVEELSRAGATSG